MALDEALKRARKKHPDLRLGQLLCTAVALSSPDKSETAENKAKLLDRIYSMSDKELAETIMDLDKNLKEVQNALEQGIEKMTDGFRKAIE